MTQRNPLWRIIIGINIEGVRKAYCLASARATFLPLHFQTGSGELVYASKSDILVQIAQSLNQKSRDSEHQADVR